jgi:hypothetical protein
MKTLPELIGVWLFACLFLGACAPVTPRYTAKAYVDPSEDKHADWVSAAYDVEGKDTQDVELWEKGQVPAGITVLGQGRAVEISEAFKDQYEAIGSIKLDLKSARQWNSMRNTFWTWNYEDKWRRYLCWPQIPLRYLTLIYFWRIVPTNYPCEARQPSDDEEARELLLRRAKALAKAMGGNTVILTDEFRRTYRVGNSTENNASVYDRGSRQGAKKLDGLRGVVVRNKLFETPLEVSGESEAPVKEGN